MAAGKRASVGGHGRPRAKKAKVAPDSLEAMLETVAAAVDRATTVSPTSREMLRLMSAGCLGTPADQRHRYQAVVAEMLRDVLARAEEAVAEGIGEAAAEVDRAAARVSSLAASRGALDAAFSTRSEALETAKAGFRKGNTCLQEARKRLDEAAEVQRRGDGDVRKAGATKEAMEGALREHYPELFREGAGLATHVDALTRVNKEAGVDEGLAKAFMVAARKEPKTRSMFDKVVLKQLESEYSRRLAELNEIIAAGSPGLEERAAVVVSAEAALAEARGKQRETAQALRGAELDRREAEAEAWASKDAEKAAACELRRAEGGSAAAERDLEDFRAGPLKSLEALLARRSAPTASAAGEAAAGACGAPAATGAAAAEAAAAA